MRPRYHQADEPERAACSTNTVASRAVIAKQPSAAAGRAPPAECGAQVARVRYSARELGPTLERAWLASD